MGMLGIIRVESTSSTIPPPDPERSLPEVRQISRPDLSRGRQFMPPGIKTANAVEFPSGSNASVATKGATVAGKGVAVSTEFALRIAVHKSQGEKLLLLNSPSGRLDLPMEGGQSLQQMALGAGFRRSEKPPTGSNNVPRLGKLESKNLVGDKTESGEQGCTTQNRTKIHRRQGRNGGGDAGAEAEVHCVHRGPHTVGKPEGGVLQP